MKLIQFKGNVKYSAAELGKEVTVVEGGLLNDKALRESAQNLRKFYNDKGYTDNRVTAGRHAGRGRFHHADLPD